MSKEYIEKWAVVDMLTALENEFQQYKPFHGFEHAMYRKVCETEIAIGKTPAADVVEVKHGYWKYSGSVLAECQNCGEIYSLTGNLDREWNYCPNCGADMRGADNG